MKLSVRKPREVYRVYDEDDFLEAGLLGLGEDGSRDDPATHADRREPDDDRLGSGTDESTRRWHMPRAIPPRLALPALLACVLGALVGILLVNGLRSHGSDPGGASVRPVERQLSAQPVPTKDAPGDHRRSRSGGRASAEARAGAGDEPREDVGHSAGRRARSGLGSATPAPAPATPVETAPIGYPPVETALVGSSARAALPGEHVAAELGFER